jgi:hypothetical protein
LKIFISVCLDGVAPVLHPPRLPFDSQILLGCALSSLRLILPTSFCFYIDSSQFFSFEKLLVESNKRHVFENPLSLFAN